MENVSFNIIINININKNIAFTSHNACRKNILKEIEENENEEDSFGRNESQMKQNKNDTENQSDIYFNQNNKINFNNNERGEKDYNSKGVLNFKENDGKKYKLKINTDLFERNEKDIFNNYISHTPKNLLENANKLYTINYLNSFNNKDNLSNNNIKPSLNYFWTQKKNASSKVKIIDDNLRDKILKVKANENNQKVSLPKLNNDIKETKRSLTSNQKKRNLYTDGNIPSTNINSIKKFYIYSNKNNNYKGIKENNKNEDNYRLNLLSASSKSSNIIIPIMTSQNSIDENVKNGEILNNRNIKIINRLAKSTDQNNSNKINEFIKNKVKEANSRNTLLKKFNQDKDISKNNNLFVNIDNSFMSKLHQIKIQKGIMDNKIFERMKKDLLFNDHNGFVVTENNKNINIKLPLIKRINERNLI